MQMMEAGRREQIGLSCGRNLAEPRDCRRENGRRNERSGFHDRALGFEAYPNAAELIHGLNVTR